MPNTLQNLQAEVLRLSPADRSRMLEALIASLDDDPELEAAWDAEADRRETELASGTAEPVPLAEALGEARVAFPGVNLPLHPAAEREIEDASAFYEREGSPALAARFIREVRRVASLLVERPRIGSPRARGRLGLPMRLFPYTVIYRVLTGSGDWRRPSRPTLVAPGAERATPSTPRAQS